MFPSDATFSDYFARLNDSIGSNNTRLVGILAAEGAPTYFIDGFPGRADIYAQSHDKIQTDVARDWLKHQKRLPELYAQTALDIERNLNGEATTNEIFNTWMGGIKGAAEYESELSKQFGHFVQDFTGVHDAAEEFSLTVVAKHVECVDCHAHIYTDVFEAGGKIRHAPDCDIALARVALGLEAVI